MKQVKTYIYGKHALTEALINTPHVVKEVFLSPQVKDEKIKALIAKHKISKSVFHNEKDIDKSIQSASHQGVIAVISPEELVQSYDVFMKNLKVTPNTSLILLDELQDPHNVGAIIRSAAAFGVSGILIPKHNQASITGAVVKVSAGMAFNIPLVAIGNVNTTVRDLKEKGFWIYGLDEGGDNVLHTETFDAPAVFILGNESKGIRQKTQELCDIILSISINQKCESLNVAASTATMLYAWSLQHPDVLKD